MFARQYTPQFRPRVASGFDHRLATLLGGGPPGDPLLFIDSSGVDTIGLPIGEIHHQLDPTLQFIVSADGGVTRRDDAEIYVLAVAVGDTAEMLVDDNKKILLIYADGSTQDILDDAAAWIERRPLVGFEQFYVADGAFYSHGNEQVYVRA